MTGCARCDNTGLVQTQTSSQPGVAFDMDCPECGDYDQTLGPKVYPLRLTGHGMKSTAPRRTG